MKQLGDKYQKRKQELSLRDRLNSIDFRGIGKNIIGCIPIAAMAGLFYGCSPEKDYGTLEKDYGTLHTGIVRKFDKDITTINYEKEAAINLSKTIKGHYSIGKFRFIYEGDTATVTRFTDKLAHELIANGYEQVADTTQESVLDIKFTTKGNALGIEATREKQY